MKKITIHTDYNCMTDEFFEEWVRKFDCFEDYRDLERQLLENGVFTFEVTMEDGSTQKTTYTLRELQ